MTRLFPFIIMLILLTSCAFNNVLHKQESQVTLSPEFTYEPGQVVALLPFAESGHKGFNTLVTDRFAANLTLAGFTVKDRATVEQAAATAKIDLLHIPSQAQIATLGKHLGVDIIIVGSCSYRKGAKSENEEAVIMISARFLNAVNGDTLIYANTYPDGVVPVTRALAMAIRSTAMKDLFRKGVESYYKTHYAEAIARFNTLLAMDATQIEVYHNRGAAYLKTGDYHKALADYDRALTLLEKQEGTAPGSFSPPTQAELSTRAELRFGRGIVLVTSGKPQAAISDFTEALAAGYDPATIHANLGNAYFRMKEFNNALIEYGKAIKLDPIRPDYYYQRGLVLEEVNTLNALEDFSKAINLDSRYSLALAASGRANLKLGHKTASIDNYTRALTFEPKNWQYLTGRGDAYFQAGDADRAIKDYSAAIEANATYNQAYLGRALSYAAKGEDTSAANDFSRVLSSGTSISGAAYLEAGIFQAKQGKYRQAIDNFSKAIDASGKDGVVYSNRGKALQMMASYRDAAQDFSRSLDARADNPQDYFNRGYASMQTGGYRQAIDDFTKAATLAPDYALIFSNRGYAYQKSGKFDQAISDYSQALTLIQPDQSEPLYRYRYPEAQLVQVAEAFQPFFIYYNRGLSYLAAGKYRPALADFNTASELVPNSAEVYAKRGKAHQQVGEMEQALADYNQAIALDDHLADAYLGRGSLKEQAGNLPAAIVDYTKAIDIAPDFSQAYYSRGLLRVQMHIVESGMTDVKTAARINLQEAKDYLMTRGVAW